MFIFYGKIDDMKEFGIERGMFSRGLKRNQFIWIYIKSSMKAQEEAESLLTK